MRLVGGGITCIGDDHETIGCDAGDNQVIDDARIFVQEKRIFGMLNFQFAGVDRASPVEHGYGAWSRHLKQLHMRDVEQADMFARVQMFLHDAGRIGQRHGPAGKGTEFGARGSMQILEWKGLGGIARHIFSRAAQ